MNRFFVLSCIGLILFFSPGHASAQSRFEFSIDFATAFPQNGFGDVVDHAGYGLNMEFFYRLPHTPLQIGGTFGYIQYGSQTRTEPLSPTIPDIVVDVDTTNNILLTHFAARYLFRKDEVKVRPFLEGLVGFNYLFTQSSIGSGDDQISSTNFDDSAFSGGVGGGTLIRLYGAPAGEPEAFRLDLKLEGRYLFGGNARYLKEGDLHTVGDQVFFTPSKSDTDLFSANFGISFSF